MLFGNLATNHYQTFALLLVAFAVVVLCIPAAAQECSERCAYYEAQKAAGCPRHQMGEEGHEKAAQLAMDIRDFLQDNTAEVILIGRAGSNAPDERFQRQVGEDSWNYTHGALAFRHHQQGEWAVVQLLNICRELGGVFVESLEEFFLDNPYEYRAVVAIPSPEMQSALQQIILMDDLAKPLHDDAIYSSISNPFSLERQNSNEYILDVLAAALAHTEGRSTTNRRVAKNYFLSSPYRDSLTLEMIQAGLIERLALKVGLGPDNVTLDDHPPQSRAAGEYEFVSVGALVQFLDELGHLIEQQNFALSDIDKASDTILIE